MTNIDVRQAAAAAGVRLWQIADELGMKDYNLSRKFRHELNQEERERIFAIIQALSSQEDTNAKKGN